jgi:hypothetical protein
MKPENCKWAKPCSTCADGGLLYYICRYKDTYFGHCSAQYWKCIKKVEVEL